VSPSNFLLLDEPTNHLDMRAKDVLLDAIAAFSGTVVFVSHDRYFIDRLATRVIEVENGVITSYPGNYEDYLRKKEELAAGASSAEGSSSTRSDNHIPDSKSSDKIRVGSTAAATVSSGTTIVIEGGVDGLATWNKSRRLNPIKQKQMVDRCAFLEEEIPRVEASIAHTEEQLAVYISSAETQRLTELGAGLREQLARLTAEWEELMLQLEGV
jgi:ATP-binding cassette, subfamily F, member 3